MQVARIATRSLACTGPIAACGIRSSTRTNLRPSLIVQLSQRREVHCEAARCRNTHRIATMSAADASYRADNRLWQRLTSTYDKARTDGDVLKTDTDDKVFTDPALGVGFVLRVAAALNSKPKAPKQDKR